MKKCTNIYLGRHWHPLLRAALREAAKKPRSFFSGSATKSWGDKGLATKKKDNILKLKKKT